MDIKLWLSNAGTKIKENLPAVIRNYPYSSAILVLVGVFIDGVVRFIF